MGLNDDTTAPRSAGGGPYALTHDSGLTTDALAKNRSDAIGIDVRVRGEIIGSKHKAEANWVSFELCGPDLSQPAPIKVYLAGAPYRTIANYLRRNGSSPEEAFRDGAQISVSGRQSYRSDTGMISVAPQRVSLPHADPGPLARRRADARAEADDNKRRLPKFDDEQWGAVLNTKALGRTPRIAVVTGTESVVYDDIVNGLSWGAKRFALSRVTVRLNPGATDSLVAALDTLAADPPDLIAIVRGGGSALDYALFDDPSLIRTVRDHPVPIVTAIGHAPDKSACDLAAHNSFSTPQALGRWLKDMSNPRTAATASSRRGAEVRERSAHAGLEDKLRAAEKTAALARSSARAAEQRERAAKRAEDEARRSEQAVRLAANQDAATSALRRIRARAWWPALLGLLVAATGLYVALGALTEIADDGAATTPWVTTASLAGAAAIAALVFVVFVARGTRRARRALPTGRVKRALPWNAAGAKNVPDGRDVTTPRHYRRVYTENGIAARPLGSPRRQRRR